MNAITHPPVHTSYGNASIVSFRVEAGECGVCGHYSATLRAVDCTKADGRAGDSIIICGACRMHLIHHLSAPGDA